MPSIHYPIGVYYWLEESEGVLGSDSEDVTEIDSEGEIGIDSEGEVEGLKWGSKDPSHKWKWKFAIFPLYEG